VTSGAGSIEGDFGRLPVRRGETFALPASLAFRLRAGQEPVRVIRCLGPAVDEDA
jgi:mannose-6-phosphate isomerase class I